MFSHRSGGRTESCTNSPERDFYTQVLSSNSLSMSNGAHVVRYSSGIHVSPYLVQTRARLELIIEIILTGETAGL